MFIKNQTHISTSLSSWPWQFGYCQTCKHCLTNQNLCCTGLMCQWAAVLLCHAHKLESYVSSMKVLVRALILHSEHCQPSLTCLDIIANRWLAAGSCTTSYKYPRLPGRKSGVGAATRSPIFHNRGFPSHTMPGCWALIGHCSVTWPRHELSLAAEPRAAAARQPVVKFEIFNTLFLHLPLLHAGF